MYCTAQWLELILQNFKEKIRCGIISIIPAFSRLRQRNSKFKTNLEKKKTNLTYTVRLRLRRKKAKNYNWTHTHTNKQKKIAMLLHLLFSYI